MESEGDYIVLPNDQTGYVESQADETSGIESQTSRIEPEFNQTSYSQLRSDHIQSQTGRTRDMASYNRTNSSQAASVPVVSSFLDEGNRAADSLTSMIANSVTHRLRLASSDITDTPSTANVTGDTVTDQVLVLSGSYQPRSVSGLLKPATPQRRHAAPSDVKIGRASCRERV